MGESAKHAWSEVGERFSSWGRRVADHYHQTDSTEPSHADDAERELRSAMKDLFEELSRGVSALGSTIRDDQANKDLSEAVNAIGDAITATVNEATEAIRSKGGSSPPPPPPPPPPADD